MKVQLALDFEADIGISLKKRIGTFKDYRVRSKSLDARGINRGKRPKFNYTIEVIKDGEEFEVLDYETPNLGPLKSRPIIIGAGPCGLFTALRLLDYGIPSVIFERGESSLKRMKSIAKFWKHGILDTDNNVCFGEGGAGLFSDGKLVTRVKSQFIGYVMRRLVDFGAPKDTAYLANPHLGSNKMRGIIHKLSAYLKEMGCEIHYNTRVDEILFSSDGSKAEGVKLSDGRDFLSDHVVLATGHSAHDIYKHLIRNNIAMKSKDFAVGVRVEHPSLLINSIQHGNFASNPLLGTAKYRVSNNNKSTDRGTYSFCMCPGGYVLSTGTDADGLVTNGMSNADQNSKWSNSAIITTVKKGRDFDENDILAGLNFQREIEKKAFEVSKEFATGKELPAVSMIDFLNGKVRDNKLNSSSPSKVFSSDMTSILPSFVIDELRVSLEKFDKNMKGYISKDAVLIAPETRTSSPITILRDRMSLVSETTSGLYPCGEGAGYAGGITSAAVDGVNVAMSIVEKEGRV